VNTGELRLQAVDPDASEFAYYPFGSEIFLHLYYLYEVLCGPSEQQMAHIQGFANDLGQLNGFLDTGRAEPVPGDTLETWQAAVVRLGTAVSLWQILHSNRPVSTAALERLASSTQSRRISTERVEPDRHLDTAVYRRFQSAPTAKHARDALADFANQGTFLHLRSLLALRLETMTNGRYEVVARPSGLLVAAWLQFIDVLTSGARCKNCEQCGRITVLRAGDHSNRLYCGPTCKQRAWRHGETRKRRAARRRRT
jgi:hypothetical protein